MLILIPNSALLLLKIYYRIIQLIYKNDLLYFMINLTTHSYNCLIMKYEIMILNHKKLISFSVIIRHIYLV